MARIVLAYLSVSDAWHPKQPLQVNGTTGVILRFENNVIPDPPRAACLHAIAQAPLLVTDHAILFAGERRYRTCWAVAIRQICWVQR